MTQVCVAVTSLGIVWNIDIVSSSEGWSITFGGVNGVITILINIGLERTEIIFVTKGKYEAV
jgi:hypothetical protein